MPEMTGGDAVYYALKALGVDTVFGIPSVHNVPIFDAIKRHGGIKTISARHEQGMVHMADGYARVTGKLGVAIASTGPGAANTMGGLFEAAFASSPVLMITGQVDTPFYGKAKGFLHEAESQLPMLRSITRRTESVRRTEDIADTILRVVRDICTGRPQPGAVEIPIDLQYASADVEIPAPVGATPKVQPNLKAVADAVALLNGAKRPIIWAGGGVNTADASAELVKLAETLNAPVYTTVMGQGVIPFSHPLNLGAISEHVLMEGITGEADVILAVGTRFQGRATRNWVLPIPGKIIHLDADPGVIGRNYPAAVAITGDAQLGLAAILKGVSGGQTEADFVSRAQTARDATRKAIREQMGPKYEEVLDMISELLPRDGIFARDMTVPAYVWANRLLPVARPRSSIIATSGGIGNAFPLAIGAAIGSGKKTFLVAGDGGFQQTLGELACATQHNVPIIVCIFNDKGYGVLRGVQTRNFEGRMIGVDLTTPDYVMLAKSMGMQGESVANVGEFKGVLERAIEARGPVIIDLDMSGFV